MAAAELAVRRATAADVDRLTDLAARTFRDAYAGELDAAALATYVDATFTPAKIAAELAQEGAVFFLGSAGGALVGYAMLRDGDAPAAVPGDRPVELARIYVEQDATGKGYGAALLSACLAEAAARGADTLWLAVWARNERAQAFYRRRGFAVVGKTSFVFNDELHDDLVMARPAPSPRDLAPTT